MRTPTGLDWNARIDKVKELADEIKENKELYNDGCISRQKYNARKRSLIAEYIRYDKDDMNITADDAMDMWNEMQAETNWDAHDYAEYYGCDMEDLEDEIDSRCD